MNPPKTQIAHFDLDAFFVSVERLKDSSLVGKPVIVGGHSNRGVVAACSYETRKFGVHSAMPMRQAKQLCPQAIVVSGSMSDYSHYSRLVTNMLSNALPVLEKASVDEFYADMTGMEKFFGCYPYLKELKKKIVSETGLPISFALASNKLLSKIATNEAKPNGEIHILPGTEKAFLAPLKIEKMPMIGESTATFLHRQGIHTIGQLADMPITNLEKLLGKNGASLWQKANGISSATIQPYHEQKSISSETTFEKDYSDLNFLWNQLARLTEKNAHELRQDGKMTSCVAIKIRYSNFDTTSKQITLAYTASDHLLLKVVNKLFKEFIDTERPVRLVGVRFSHFIEQRLQLSLFDNELEKGKLYSTIDQLKNQFGNTVIQRATTFVANKNHQTPLWIERNKAGKK